jgi:hypothetical protein
MDGALVVVVVVVVVVDNDCEHDFAVCVAM